MAKRVPVNLSYNFSILLIMLMINWTICWVSWSLNTLSISSVPKNSLLGKTLNIQGEKRVRLSQILNTSGGSTGGQKYLSCIFHLFPMKYILLVRPLLNTIAKTVNTPDQPKPTLLPTLYPLPLLPSPIIGENWLIFPFFKNKCVSCIVYIYTIIFQQTNKFY